MQCWQCGRSVRPGAKLCIYCGAKLADDEEQVPRTSGARNGRRSSELGGYRSLTSRGDEDDRGDVPSDGESEEYVAYNLPDAGDDHPGDRHQHRAPSRPRDDGDYPDRSKNNPRPRESRLRDPMDDPRAPIPRGRGASPPSARERREPPADSDGYRRGSRDLAMEERTPHGSRREGRDDYAGYDNGRAASSSSSRRRSDMEHGGGHDARGGRGDGYDDRRHERGLRRDRRPDPQLERDWEHGGDRGDRGDRGDAREMRYPQAPLDDSWGMPAVGGAPLADWGIAPSEEMPTPMGARAGRDARGRSGSAGRGGASNRGGKTRRGSGGHVVRLVSLLLVIIGLIGTGVLVAPKILSHFGGAKGNGLDAQPPFATYTPGPTPTVLPKYARYVSQHLQFAIDYPKEWSAGESPVDAGKTDYVDTLKQPTPQAALLVEQSSGFDGISNDEMIHDEVLASQSDGSTFTETTTTPAHAQIGGEQWLRRDFDVVSKAGTKLHMGILSCHHLGHGYVIVLVSLPQNFVHDDQTAFQSILSTFRFLV